MAAIELADVKKSYGRNQVVHGVDASIEAGEFVTITCGQANLKRGIIAAQPTNGDLVQIHYEGTYKAAKGDGKTFKVRIARGAAKRDEGDLI